MKLLLHICCAPCGIYPLQRLGTEAITTVGYFYRTNIQPYSECLRRFESLRDYADRIRLNLIVAPEYDLEWFLRNLAFREKERCLFCYHTRLQATARIAKRGGFDAFSTTLLYSKYQNHDLIKEVAQNVAQAEAIAFYYADFRIGWSEGVKESKRLGMYRQQYCGCIYSEKERFYRKPAESFAAFSPTD
jgi:predicted adenine nucleotide alpha hydrolase (AANH) superfamily ATPase